MAQNPANIHIGAARIFLGVTPPATGNPPQLLVHNDGTPLSGVEVGYTQDAATFTYKQNKQEVVAEQSLNPVDVFVVSEEIQIEFTAMEHVYTTLKAAFDNVGSDDDAARMLFWGGDGGNLISVQTQCVALTSRIRTSPKKFEVLCLYRVYNVEGVAIPYNRTGEAIYKITLKGLVDAKRTAGDRLFQWFREKAAPLATGAVAGAPGSWYPTGSSVPMTQSEMGGVQPVDATGLIVTAHWTVGQYVTLDNGSKVYWNESAWVPGIVPATYPMTKATQVPGAAGTWSPTGGTIPMHLSDMGTITPVPASAWVEGSFMTLGDSSKCYWNNAVWVQGVAPAALV